MLLKSKFEIVLINGNDVNPLQADQVERIEVANPVSINGKDVNPVQPNQALLKLDAPTFAINGNDVNPVQPLNACEKLSTVPVFVLVKLVKLVKSVHISSYEFISLADIDIPVYVFDVNLI